MDVARRLFLRSSLAGLIALPTLSLADVFDTVDTLADDHAEAGDLVTQGLAVPRQDFPRILHLRRGREAIRADVYTRDGYSQLAWLARDVQAGNVVGVPDPRLVRLTLWTQAWLRTQGYHDALWLNSGLRTPRTNRSIEGAAQASEHLPDAQMRFRAFDLESDRVPASVLARLGLAAGEGGVGYYPHDGHVHLDTGRVRFWRKG